MRRQAKLTISLRVKPIFTFKLKALAARCELYLIAENKEAAAKDAKEAARLNPKDVGNLLAVAQTQLTANKIELGITTLEQALELEHRPDVCLMLSRALRIRNASGDCARSVRVVRKPVAFFTAEHDETTHRYQHHPIALHGQGMGSRIQLPAISAGTS